MEDCLICYSKQKSFKILPCQHKLCHSCFLKLDTCNCPYCRKKFFYTKEESIKRASMNIDYRNWHPPSQLTLPEGFTNINNPQINNNINNYTNSNNTNTTNYILNNEIAFSRINRNRTRRRRRTLSMKEIQEKRRRIKKKCKLKWEKKNRRNFKRNWWDIQVN